MCTRSPALAAVPFDSLSLNTTDAADFLGISRGTLANWRAAGQGPAYSTLGTSVRYTVGDLMAFRDRTRVSNCD